MIDDISRKEILRKMTTKRTDWSNKATEASARYNVGIKPSSSKENVSEIVDSATSVRRRIDLDHLGIIISGKFPEQARNQFVNSPQVKYVERDGTVHKLAETEPWGIDRIDADILHANGRTGDGTSVAVLDTGVDDDHPDLPPPVQGKCFSDDCCGERNSCSDGSEAYNNNPCNYSWSDDDDHGSHVAGTISALENTEGVIGVGLGIDIMAGKVLNGCGFGFFSSIADGLKWATDNGADVINMSFGAASGSSTLKDACQYAIDNNVVVVAAAGNPGNCFDCDCSSGCSNCDVNYPAGYSTVIAVSATGPDDSLARYSAVGSEVELTAPGGNVCDGNTSTSILSTIPPESDDSGDGYAYFNGTSMASPHVAGVAALVKSETSLSNNQAIRDHLRSTAEDIDLSSDKQGDGLVDAENAIPLLEEWMFNTGSRIQYASAATDNSRVLVGGLDDTLFALTQSDGNGSWQFNRSGALADSSPTISEGKVFVGSGSGIVYALDVSDGSVSWTYKTDSAIISSPTMVNGVIYVGTNDGTIFALDDSGSGSKQWATNVGEAVFSKPAVDNGTVYVSTTSGRLVALDASTGAQQWTFDTDAEVGRSSPIVSNNRLYFAADAMYAFDPETSGNVLWKTAYGGTAGASPSYSSTTGQVFVGSFNGKVYAFNASDGVVNWTHATGGAVGSTPVVAGDRVVIGSDDNNLYLIDASSGSELVRRSVGRIRSEPTVDNDTTFVGTWGGTIVALSNVTT